MAFSYVSRPMELLSQQFEGGVLGNTRKGPPLISFPLGTMSSKTDFTNDSGVKAHFKVWRELRGREQTGRNNGAAEKPGGRGVFADLKKENGRQS